MQTSEQKVAAAYQAFLRTKYPGANAAACKRYYYAKKASDLALAAVKEAAKDAA